MSIEDLVAQHYARGGLEETILDALRVSGKDPNRLSLIDLAPVDEFHIGGRQATIDFAAQFAVRPGMHLLDIGCGLGGASRYFAHERDCHVTGIDLTDEYVRTADALARRVGLSARVSYQQGSALAMPFAPDTFDGAYMLHVGMNIDDKAALFAGVRKVLKPGGVFGIYDVMRESAGDLTYPVPWASSPATSFVACAATYRALLEAAGYAVEWERSRREVSVEFFRRMRARAAQGEPPALSLRIVMGPSFAQKVANMINNVEGGLIAPTEMICRVA